MRLLGYEENGNRWFLDYLTNRIVAVTSDKIRQWPLSHLLMHRYFYFPERRSLLVHPLRIDNKLSDSQDSLLLDAIIRAIDTKLIKPSNGLTFEQAEALRKVKK